jgi:hypothetical protein
VLCDLQEPETAPQHDKVQGDHASDDGESEPDATAIFGMRH